MSPQGIQINQLIYNNDDKITKSQYKVILVGGKCGVMNDCRVDGVKDGRVRLLNVNNMLAAACARLHV